MSTLIYSPGVSVIIDSARHGPVDVSEDISDGGVNLRENGSHDFRITLDNPGRKYQGVFAPNDRIVIQMKRFRWVQVMAGYLNRAPFFSAFPGSVTISGECSMKVLKMWPWEAHSIDAYNLIHGNPDDTNTAQDGGMATRAKNILTTVAGWPEQRIHIADVPSEWMLEFKSIYNRLTEETDKLLGDINDAVRANAVAQANVQRVWDFVTFSNTQGQDDYTFDFNNDLMYDAVRQNFLTAQGGLYTYESTRSRESGGYRITDRVWDRYKGYARAKDAPPAIQDEKMGMIISRSVTSSGPILSNIVKQVYWSMYGGHGDASEHLAESPPDTSIETTVRDYATLWFSTYPMKWASVGGTGSPPLRSGVTPIEQSSTASVETPAGSLDEVLGGDPFSSKYNQLFAAFSFWQGNINSTFDIESVYLTGYRAPMNDSPLYETVVEMLNATQRSVCAAPNGDLIAWFPDYWGKYPGTGAMDVKLIEVENLNISWDDTYMKTHVYVEGGMNPNPIGSIATPTIIDATRAIFSKGIASVELPGFLPAIVNVQSSSFPWLSDPQELLQRFGARISRQKASKVLGAEQEFWYAVREFTMAWANQFSGTPTLTFMPELFPGMMLRIPELGVQFYIKEVSHSFNMTNEIGFKTGVTVVAPSSIGGGGMFDVLPIGGGYIDDGDSTFAGGGGGRPPTVT